MVLNFCGGGEGGGGGWESRKWCGCNSLVANWLIENVEGVEKFSDRVRKVNTIIEDVVWEVVSCYSPQAGR